MFIEVTDNYLPLNAVKGDIIEVVDYKETRDIKRIHGENGKVKQLIPGDTRCSIEFRSNNSNNIVSKNVSSEDSLFWVYLFEHDIHNRYREQRSQMIQEWRRKHVIDYIPKRTDCDLAFHSVVPAYAMYVTN
jgi:hypothetical protein